MKILFGPNHLQLENAIPELKNTYPDIEFIHCVKREEVSNLIAVADVYVGWLNRDLFLAAENLKWVQSSSSGVDYLVAIPELVESDVLLTSASGTHAAGVAESAIAMILAFTRGIRESVFRQQQRQWAGGEIRRKLVELTRSTMGIIGFGKIGREIAKRVSGFEPRIIAVDLYPGDKPDYVSGVWGFDRLDDLLRESDYVVVAVPRTPQTRGMIGQKQLALMKPTAMLVGMSRGGIIDETALVQSLRENRLAAAALDVFAKEPLPEDSELWDVENLLVTPHVSGGTQFEGQYVLDIFRENLERFVRGELPLRNQVDKQRGF
ncbi:D-2-hydroxyacid dehydrogenase [Candidatus Poribacteria bacterium]|nr:D-2-hydroxyacid dehydrogenase [Candidatus Poribacteria bacterium]